MSASELPKYLQQPNQNCRYEYLSSAELLYIQINRNSSDETCSQADFSQDIEALADSISPNSIVFEVRFNTGGSNEETEKITKAIPAWFKSVKNIYIVTGPPTFSAGIIAAARLKYFSGGRAVMVGEPAGEGLTMWSEGPRFTLPNSRLQVKAATALHDFAQAHFELGKTFFPNLFFAVPAGNIDVDFPVTLSFQDYFPGMTPCLRPSLRGRITLKLGGKNIGIMLAGIWFVLTGLIPLLSISMADLNLIMAVLAVATGVVLLLGK